MSDLENKKTLESIEDSVASKRGRLSEWNLWGIVLRDELREYPEYTKELLALKRKLEELKWVIKEDYAKVKDYESQKEFAFRVVHLDHAPALFAMRKGISLDDYFASCNTSFVISLIRKVL